jgi:hypothetical protein
MVANGDSAAHGQARAWDRPSSRQLDAWAAEACPPATGLAAPPMRQSDQAAPDAAWQARSLRRTLGSTAPCSAIVELENRMPAVLTLQVRKTPSRPRSRADCSRLF